MYSVRVRSRTCYHQENYPTDLPSGDANNSRHAELSRVHFPRNRGLTAGSYGISISPKVSGTCCYHERAGISVIGVIVTLKFFVCLLHYHFQVLVLWPFEAADIARELSLFVRCWAINRDAVDLWRNEGIGLAVYAWHGYALRTCGLLPPRVHIWEDRVSPSSYHAQVLIQGRTNFSGPDNFDQNHVYACTLECFATFPLRAGASGFR